MRTYDMIRPIPLVLAMTAWLAVQPADAQPPSPATEGQPAAAGGDPAQPAPADAGAEPATPEKKADEPKAESKEPSAEQWFTRGRDALYAGRYDEAIALLSKAVAADDTKTGYRLHLARAYRYAGQDQQAADHLEQILKAAPDHVEAGQSLAAIHSAAQRWKDVVRVLEPLLRYRHDYPTYHMLAEAQYHLGKHEEARKHYQQAVKLNPQSAMDHYQLGNIYLAGNFFALAAESYQSALRLGTDSPVLRYKLGSAYFNLRNYFGRIAVRTVKSGKAGTISGPWYLIEPVPGRKDVFRCAPETSAVYQVARSIADGIEDRPDIHMLRATIYLNARRYAQAYDMFTHIGPNVPDEDKALYHYYHAQAAFGTGQYDRYLELLKQAIKLDPAAYEPSLVDAYLKVADQYNQAGRLDKHIEFLGQAVAQSPRTASLHLKLGYAYEEADRYGEAVAQWQMVLDLEPEHPERMKLLNLIQKHRSVAAAPGSPDESDETDRPSESPAAQ